MKNARSQMSMLEEEVIEAGLSIRSVKNESAVVAMEVEAVMADCGFIAGTEEANAVLTKVLSNLKRNLAPLIPILEGSKKALENPGCKQWNFENEQAVQPPKVYKVAPVSAEAAASVDKKAEVKAAEKANDKAIIKAAKEAAVTTVGTTKSNNKKETTAMAKSREEKKMDWNKVNATNNTNKNVEDTTMNKNVVAEDLMKKAYNVVAAGVKKVASLDIAREESGADNSKEYGAIVPSVMKDLAAVYGVSVKDVDKIVASNPIVSMTLNSLKLMVNDYVVEDTKTVVADGLAALKGLASDYGVSSDDVKAAAATKSAIAPVAPTNGMKKLRVGAASNRTRNPFWYRDYEGVDLSKGELVEYENAGNLRYIVTMDEPMYGVSRVLFFATHSTNANALCDVMVELDNGLLLKGFKIWNSKENDGSVSLLSPRYSYAKKDEAKGTSEVAYGSHVEFRDKEGKMTASGFVATILACADCIFSDGTAADDDEE